MLKVSDIAAMDEKAITAKVSEFRNELFGLKMDKRTSGLEKPHKLKIVKKNIARLLTVLNQKKGNE